MPKAVIAYVKAVEKISRVSGLFAMYMIFLMIGILAYASIVKVFFLPANWTVEMAQFVMVAYFTLGGAFSLREDEHVRMDLLYAGWNIRRRSKTDLATGLVLIAFLVVLLVGGIASLIYAFEYGEKSYSAWAPVMWPIKVIINVGVFLTLLQAVAIWFKDLAIVRGEPIS